MHDRGAMHGVMGLSSKAEPAVEEDRPEPRPGWPGKLTRTLRLPPSHQARGPIQRREAAVQRDGDGAGQSGARRYRLPLQLVSFGARPPQAEGQVAHATRVYGALGITLEPIALSLPEPPARPADGSPTGHVLDREEQQWSNSDGSRPPRALDQGPGERMENGQRRPPEASGELLALLHQRVRPGQIAVYWIPAPIRDSPNRAASQVDAMTYDQDYYQNVRRDEEGIVITATAGPDVLTHELGHILMRIGHNDQSAPEERANPNMDDTAPDPDNVMARGGARTGSEFSPQQRERLYRSRYLIAAGGPTGNGPGGGPAGTGVGPTQRAATDDATSALAPARLQRVAEHGLSGATGRLPFVDVICASFGHHDVSEVRAAVGGSAAEAAATLGAHAYAAGDAVAFAHAPDLFLAAHEAAHVIQQRHGVQLDGGLGQAGDAYEQHADVVAAAVVRGESAQPLLDGGPGGARDAVGDRATPRSAAGAAVQRQERAPGPVRTQYPWLRAIVVHCGAMPAPEADRWLDGLALEQVGRVLAQPVEPSPAGGPAATTTGANPERPPAVIGHGGGHPRSRPLDWSAPAEAQPRGGGRLTADHPGGREGSLGDDFRGHREAELQRTFGPATIAQVQQTIRVAEATGRPAAAEVMRGLLFRCNQYAVVDSLNVEASSRYRPGADRDHDGEPDTTYCNVYAHDVVTALGGYLPRVWWTGAALRDLERGRPVEARLGTTVRELSADALDAWLREWGRRFGWDPIATAEAAQRQANSGHLVIASATGRGRESGHVNVVLAEDASRGREAHRTEGDDGRVVDAPLSSQAGGRNYDYSNRHDRQGTGDAYYDNTQWWRDADHEHGRFYVWRGSSNSPIATPEELGWRPDPGPVPGPDLEGT